VQAKLSELKAGVKSSAAGARIKYAKQVDELEQKMDITKAKLINWEFALQNAH